MKIRKFTAPSVPLALQQVRDALGDRAVILNTRKLPQADDPQARVEVTAALDDTAPARAPREAAPREGRMREPVAVAPVGARTERGAQRAAAARPDLLERVYGRSRPPEILASETRLEAQPDTQVRSRQRRWQDAEPQPGGVKERHIRSAAEWLAGLPSVAGGTAADAQPATRLEQPPARSAQAPLSPPTRRDSDGEAPAAVSDALVVSQLRQLEETVHRMARQASGFELPAELARLGERLRRTGLAETHIRGCLQALLRELDDDAVGAADQVSAAAARWLCGMLPEGCDLRIGKGRKVVAFVGASGSGKTTAAARIAAGFARRTSARARRGDAAPIVLVSADTRRVGALAQIQAFSELIRVPLATAYDADDMRAANATHADARLLLIDAGGCGPHEREALDAQRRLLEAAGVDEVHVVVDGLTGYEHIVETARTWADAGAVRLLVTKMDQGIRPGVVVSAAIDSGLPLSYLTVSAGVPGGIRPGDLTPWVKWMVGLSPRPFTEADV